jgi:predicted RNase H-like HicB family nuclease
LIAESDLFHAQFLFKSRHGRRIAAALALALAKEFSDSFAMRKNGKQEFSVVVERDEEGYYVASVPVLPGCHTQARSLDKLMERVREAIALCLEVEHESTNTEFIGVQRVAV